MPHELGAQEEILKKILGLDLKRCEISVSLASAWQGVDTLSFRRIVLTDEMLDMFRGAIDSALEKHRKGLHTHDIELCEFSADTDKPEHEIEYLNFLPYESIKAQVEPIEKFLDLTHFEHQEVPFVKDLRFYVIRVQPTQGAPVFFYRKYSQSQMLEESPWFAMRFLQKDLYSQVTEPIFLFDRHIDCIRYHEHLFILQKHNFYYIFSFKEFEKVAREVLEKLEQKDFIHNFNRFKSDCLHDKNKILKLKNISMKSYLDKLTINDLHKTIRMYKLEVTVELIEGKQKMVYDPRDRWTILKLLDDSYLDSNMTAESYYAKGKRGVRKR